MPDQWPGPLGKLCENRLGDILGVMPIAAHLT